MKITSKLALAILATSLIATTVASADDQQLENRLALQRNKNTSSVLQATGGRTTTMAVYAGQHGSGRSSVATQEQPSEVRFELHTNGHGQQFGLYTAEH